jgi:hypothetical protein
MAYHERSLEEEIGALKARFLAGSFTETVLRASLYALRLRGDELERAARDIISERHNHERPDHRTAVFRRIRPDEK